MLANKIWLMTVDRGVPYRRCGTNFRATLDTVINSAIICLSRRSENALLVKYDVGSTSEQGVF